MTGHRGPITPASTADKHLCRCATRACRAQHHMWPLFKSGSNIATGSILQNEARQLLGCMTGACQRQNALMTSTQSKHGCDGLTATILPTTLVYYS